MTGRATSTAPGLSPVLGKGRGQLAVEHDPIRLFREPVPFVLEHQQLRASPSRLQGSVELHRLSHRHPRVVPAVRNQQRRPDPPARDPATDYRLRRSCYDACHFPGDPMIRRRVSELMDDPTLDHDEHRRALRSLNRVNRWLGTDKLLYCRLRPRLNRDRFSLLDLGSGGGSFLRYTAAQHELPAGSQLIGLDRSAYALIAARNWSTPEPISRRDRPVRILWIAADARRIPLPDESVDVVVCSLFLHHFDTADIVQILSESARVARQGLVASDLIRLPMAWYVTWLATRLFSRSHVCHVDGPRSVQAALRPDELRECATQAGLTGASIETHFPFRMTLAWRRNDGEHGGTRTRG